MRSSSFQVAQQQINKEGLFWGREEIQGLGNTKTQNTTQKKHTKHKKRAG